MNRKFAHLVIWVLVLGLTDSNSVEASTIKIGASCQKLNQVINTTNNIFICSKSNKKLIWKLGKSVPDPAPLKNTIQQNQVPLNSSGSQGTSTSNAPTHTIELLSDSSPVISPKYDTSFEIPAGVSAATKDSNLKLWIYDPSNSPKSLGSPGIYFQKDGGSWYFVGTKTSDGSFDTRLDPGEYLFDVVEPNGNQKTYSRGRYKVSVSKDYSLSILGLSPNSKGYYTVTAILNGRRQNEISSFVQTSPCQLIDQTGSPNMSNGFPRASGRLPTTGVVRALIIPVDFSDLQGSGNPQVNYLDMANGTADFYYKESNHKLQFKFSTFNSYQHLNVPVSAFNMGSYNGGDSYSYFMAGLKSVSSKVDLSQFDIAYVLPPPNVAMNQIAYGPAFPGNVDSKDFSTESGRILNGAVGGADAYQNLAGAKWKWMAHETGHTFGLYDWYTLDGTNPYGSWDIMSNNWSTQAIEFNAWNRYILGWLSDTQIQCQEKNKLSTSGVTLQIESMGVDSQKPKAIMVKIDDSKILVIEARTTAGLDVIPGTSSGVLVYKVDMTIPTIKGMATTFPRAGSSKNLNDAPLHVGDFTVVEGIKVSVNSSNQDNFSVTVSQA
jgi:hypothetical protein